MKHQLSTLACLVSLLVAGAALAADADPTGTWKWSQTRGDQTREVTLKLKLAEGKLTGAMSGRNNTETQIEDGKFENGKVSFKLTREFNGNKVVSLYNGELKEDTIKGTVETERDGQKRSRDWEAKREK
jgi:hypothetical protein